MVTEEKCGSCGAPMFKAVGLSGKRNVIDLEPVPNGNVRIIDQGEGKLPLAIYDRKGGRSQRRLDDDGVRYVSHFATCPQSKEWRKAKP